MSDLFRKSVSWLWTHKITYRKLFACSKFFCLFSTCMKMPIQTVLFLSCVVFQAVKHSSPQKHNCCLFRIIITRPLALFTLSYENENTDSWGTALKLNSLKMYSLWIVQYEICTLRNTGIWWEMSFSGLWNKNSFWNKTILIDVTFKNCQRFKICVFVVWVVGPHSPHLYWPYFQLSYFFLTPTQQSPGFIL